MLRILQCGSIFKRKELAKELGTSDRMVREYKNALDYSGFEIESITGRYGGYRLKYRERLLGLKLTSTEMQALMTAYAEITVDKGYSYSVDFKSAVEKVNAAYNTKEIETFETSTANWRNSKSKLEQEYLVQIRRAFVENTVLEIIYYTPSRKEETRRKIHPYGLVLYKGFNYLVGYCETRNEIRDFKLTRIKECTVTNTKFKKASEFNIEIYAQSSFGLYKDNEYDVSLHIREPFAEIIKDMFIHKSQNIITKEDGSIIFEAQLQGKTEIITWLIGMGSAVTVLSPPELKENVKKEIEKMTNLYS